MRAKKHLRGAIAGGALAGNVHGRSARGWQPAAAAWWVAVAIAAMAAPAQAQTPQAVAFDIPAQPLAGALRLFSQQAKQQVLFDQATVAGRAAPALQGSHTPRDALERLLKGADIEVVESQPGAFTLKVAPAELRDGSIGTLATVTVSGKAFGSITEGTGSYTTGSTSSSTRLNLTPQETPQSISVLTRQRMDDQKIENLVEAFDAAPGFTTLPLEVGGAVPAVYARGRPVDSYQIDGVPRNGSLGNYLQSSAVYDRIEVVRGATGMMNGVGGLGGTVNMIRKLPTSEPQRSVSVEGGNWDRYGIGADISGALNEDASVRGRLVADVKRQGAWTTNYKQDRAVLYGVAEADLGPQSLLTAGFSYTQQDTVAPIGLTPLRYESGQLVAFKPKNGDRPNWSYYDNDQINAFISLEHQFNSGWIGKTELSRTEYKSDSLQYYRDNIPSPGAGITSTWANRSASKHQENSLDAYLTGPFSLFGRQHELIAGVTISRMTSDAPQYSANYSSGGYYIPDYFGLASSLPKPDSIRETGVENGYENKYSAYVSGKLNLSDTTKLLLGSRVVRWEKGNDRLTYSTATNSSQRQRENGLLVPYVGIVYDMNDTWSLYGSYTKIFTPQYATTRTPSGDQLEPMEGVSYEAGIKGRLNDGRLNASLSVYQIDLDNMPVWIGPGNNDYKTVNGTKTKGLEIELNGEVAAGWQFGGGYSFNAIKDQDGGNLTTVIPRHVFKVFTTYRVPGFENKLTIGGGANWYGKSSTSGLTGYAYTRSSYAIVNLMARYEISKSLTASININNVLNKEYLQGFSDWDGIHGAPRNFMLSMRYAF